MVPVTRHGRRRLDPIMQPERERGWNSELDQPSQPANVLC